MEIRDPIHGPITVSEKEKAVIDHPLVQRLRRVKQLGFAELTFPGATHSRYIHSIGTMHLAGLAFDSIFHARPEGVSDKKLLQLRQCARLAGLLHDLGHPPLSHALESSFGGEGTPGIRTHEDLTVTLIKDREISRLLNDLFREEGITSGDIAGLISGNPSEIFSEGGLDLFPVLRQMISSEMDCDRMDYLLRDSFFTGVSYGNIDLKWLISNLSWHETGGRLYLTLNSRAVFTFEDFLLSRYHMFLMIYFHNKTVIYERILQRFVETGHLRIPLEPGAFIVCDDNWLYSKLAESENIYAGMLARQSPPKLILEFWG
ncbi:MAG: HD domain-containing protein, partial [Deltaproteobacteria bacterium]|nr:HD domain-containing protein [Deltaproteobacteria bacterium]